MTLNLNTNQLNHAIFNLFCKEISAHYHQKKKLIEIEI